MRDGIRQAALSAVAAAITALVSGDRPMSVLALIVVLAFLGFTAAQRAYPHVRDWHARLPVDRRRGVSWIGVGTMLLVTWWVVETWAGPRASAWLVGDEQVQEVVHGHRWITYEPTDYDPLRSKLPSLATLEREIGWIQAAGFDGIITFTSREPFDRIPRLAKDRGLSVILGIWDPTDRRELHLAASVDDHVDAYAVGHNGLNSRYTWNQLRRAVSSLRFRTGRPVSTTERLAAYLENEELADLGDWLFADVHVSLRDPGSDHPPSFSVDVSRDVDQTIRYATKIAKVARAVRKPALLKIVTYPYDGASGASLEEQARFFAMLLEGRREVHPRLPHEIAVSVHSAFDVPWKAGWPFFPWEPYTGVLEGDGRPRPAARALVERLP